MTRSQHLTDLLSIAGCRTNTESASPEATQSREERGRAERDMLSYISWVYLMNEAVHHLGAERTKGQRLL